MIRELGRELVVRTNPHELRRREIRDAQSLRGSGLGHAHDERELDERSRCELVVARFLRELESRRECLAGGREVAAPALERAALRPRPHERAGIGLRSRQRQRPIARGLRFREALAVTKCFDIGELGLEREHLLAGDRGRATGLAVHTQARVERGQLGDALGRTREAARVDLREPAREPAEPRSAFVETEHPRGHDRQRCALVDHRGATGLLAQLHPLGGVTIEPARDPFPRVALAKRIAAGQLALRREEGGLHVRALFVVPHSCELALTLRTRGLASAAFLDDADAEQRDEPDAECAEQPVADASARIARQRVQECVHRDRSILARGREPRKSGRASQPGRRGFVGHCTSRRRFASSNASAVAP